MYYNNRDDTVTHSFITSKIEKAKILQLLDIGFCYDIIHTYMDIHIYNGTKQQRLIVLVYNSCLNS